MKRKIGEEMNREKSEYCG